MITKTIGKVVGGFFILCQLLSFSVELCAQKGMDSEQDKKSTIKNKAALAHIKKVLDDLKEAEQAYQKGTESKNEKSTESTEQKEAKEAIAKANEKDTQIMNQNNRAVLEEKEVALTEEEVDVRNKLQIAPRACGIFLDDSEALGDGATFSGFIHAMFCKEMPIIVSAYILKFFVSSYNKAKQDIGNLSYADKIAKYNRLISKQALPGETAQDLIGLFIDAAQVNPTQWIIKKVCKDLYLLLPDYYLNRVCKTIEKQLFEKSVNNEDPVTETELKVGFKVNHLETIEFNKIASIPRPKLSSADYFAPEMNNIFVTHQAYAKKAILEPLWTFYFLGHGGRIDGQENGTFAFIKVLDFKTKVLPFLNTHISTQLIYCHTCFGNGENSQKVFGETENSFAESPFNFSIVSNGLSDALVYSVKPCIKEDENNPGKTTIVSKKFSNFVAVVERQILATYPFDLATSLDNLSNEPALRANKIATIPKIKLAGTSWFSLLIRDNIISIGSLMAQSRGADKPLEIKKGQALLLFASYIPFEVKINSTDMLAVVSMIPGNAEHTFEKISANVDKNKIFSWFGSIKGLNVDKTFYIKELIWTGGSLHDVIVVYSGALKKITTIYYSPVFVCNNFAETLSCGWLLAPSEKITDYERLKAKCLESSSKGEEFRRSIQSLSKIIKGKLNTK